MLADDARNISDRLEFALMNDCDAIANSFDLAQFV